MRESGADEGLAVRPSLKALRSTMVTNLHEAGGPLEVTSKVTGHAGGEVTREHYLEISAERTRREFEDVAERLTRERPERSDRQSDHPAATEQSSEGGEDMK